MVFNFYNVVIIITYVIVLAAEVKSSFCGAATEHKTQLQWDAKQAIANMISTAVDTIRATELDMERMEYIRVNNRNSPAYEMGYIMKNLQENYRMQLEKYTLAKHMGTRLYIAELVILLVEVEHHYWEAEHLCNMIHEIERKWGFKGKFVAPAPPHGPGGKFAARDMALGDPHGNMLTSVQKIVSELSWPSKAKVIVKYFPSAGPQPNATRVSSHDLMFPSSIKFNVRPGGFPLRKNNRRFQIEAQQIPESPGGDRPPMEPPAGVPPSLVADDDKSMKLKLFRLMYEMIRDSDLKVVRAEQIRTHYTNSTSFDIGYLLGDVNDKFNVMTDIRNTVRRLYAEWRPIEHINAYEQIANQAIEINHLIDMVNTISKKS